MRNLNESSLALATIFVVALALALTFLAKSSYEAYEAQPIETDSSTDPSSLWALKRGIECTGGMSKTPGDGHYSSNAVPSGICGTGPWAKKQQGYKILKGVGGSIFERQAAAAM